MKRFSLCTERHTDALADFAAKAVAAGVVYIRIRNEREIDFDVHERENFCEKLLCVLMDIAECENPLYKNSAKLRVLARRLRETQLFARELKRLHEFFSQNRELHLEGYVTFRLCEFHEKLDTMVYSLAKKIKFGSRD